MKNGIVLEGGAMRGLFTSGVLDVFIENGITFDGAVGVSAGACFGSNLKSQQTRRSIRYNLRFAKDKRYCSVRSLIKTGDMFGADFCYHKIPDELDIFDVETFDNSPMDFWVVATDIETGRAVYHKLKDIDYNELEWIRASASIPFAARIVEVDGRKMLDGGIADSIPLKFMHYIGYEKNVVILTRPRDYVKKPSKIVPMLKAAFKDYPLFVKACADRHKMYNHELEYVHKSEMSGNTLVIAPPENLPIGRIEHDEKMLLKTYLIGRKAGVESLERVRSFLSE